MFFVSPPPEALPRIIFAHCSIMTAENIITTHFPNKELKTLYGEPYFTDIHDTHQLLKDNVPNMPTKFTNGKYGLLLLRMDPDDWEALYGQ